MIKSYFVKGLLCLTIVGGAILTFWVQGFMLFLTMEGMYSICVHKVLFLYCV